MQTFCGYIALLGRPNAGKSTLINACVGQKIVGVSKRPQTTRNRIVGVDTQGAHQFIFLDTPGIHKTAGQPKINELMNKTAWSVVGEADIVCYLVDAPRSWQAEDTYYLTAILNQTQAPVLVLASKMDKAKKAEIASSLKLISQGMQQALAASKQAGNTKAFAQQEPLAISAKIRDSVNGLREIIKSYLPEGPWLFDEDDLTDKPEKFLVAELIREKLFRHLGQELPYGTTVVIDQLKTGGRQVNIKATIITNKATHKPIIIGKGGQNLKKIGSDARQALEQHFATKVFLELYVKVVEKWIEDASLISEFQQIDEP